MTLSRQQIERFAEEGYLQLDDLLPIEEVYPVIWEFEA
tara:strand:- start:400 stop:513 length:114 start_codon:yes stop_codon:yes gene_type:complete